MSHQDKLSRRKFIQTSSLAAATLPTLTAGSYARVSGANDRLKVGIIGCGSIGGAPFEGTHRDQERSEPGGLSRL